MTTPNMSGGATRERTSITMEAHLMQRAKLASRNNLSAFVEVAVREKLMADAVREVARLRGRDDLDDLYEAAEADVEAAA